MRINDIDFLDDIEDLPIWRKQKANNYALQANFSEPTIEGINSRMSQQDGYMTRLDSFLQKGDLNKAKEEMNEMKKARINLHQSFNDSFEGTSYDCLIGACFVRAIKGEEQKIETLRDVEECSKLLKKLPSKDLKKAIEVVKKKLKIN